MANTANIAAFPQQLIESDGKTTCLFHRQWEWTMANYVPTMPKCSICGGVCDPRLTAHNLCVELQKRNLPIQVLDSTPKCNCAKCSQPASV